jgi:glycosyltransferase involved in cell wall biosynthesis
MQWIKKYQPQVEMDVLTLRDGPLRDALEPLVTNYFTVPQENTGPLRFTERIKLKIKVKQPPNRREQFIASLAASDYDLVYANTIVSIPLAAGIKRFNSKTRFIAHVHELNAIVRLLLPNFKKFDPFIDHYIAASDLVRKNLIDNWQVDADRIDRIYEFSRIAVDIDNRYQKEYFKIGGSGFVHWRKGVDLFLQTAIQLRNILTDFDQIQFEWVGKVSDKERIILEEDIRKANLTDQFKLIGQVDNPSKYFNDFDVFLMTSREDPFPLVCIEVGMLGIPIICFDGATGSQEIINQGGGVVVPYLDTDAMAKQIQTYFLDRNLLKDHGEKNKALFSKLSPEHLCPQIWELLSAIK